LSTKISSFQFDEILLEKTNSPIIVCSNTPRVIRVLNTSGFIEVSLNKLLAEKLLSKNSKERINSVYDETVEIIKAFKQPIYLIDYEMLFDPRYKLDVIKMFCDLARFIKMVVKWCGNFENDKLVYSVPNYKDYHSYNINNYNIICVI